jgi:methionyl-tRNA synthetase
MAAGSAGAAQDRRPRLVDRRRRKDEQDAWQRRRSPRSLAPTLGACALRYFLLREIPIGEDGDFAYEALLTRYNSELANDLGNLLNRTLAMVEKFCDSRARRWADDAPAQVKGEKLQLAAEQRRTEVEQAMAQLQPSKGAGVAVRLGSRGQYLSGARSSVYAHQDRSARCRCTSCTTCWSYLRWLGLMLEPFIPERCARAASSARPPHRYRCCA